VASRRPAAFFNFFSKATSVATMPKGLFEVYFSKAESLVETMASCMKTAPWPCFLSLLNSPPASLLQLPPLNHRCIPWHSSPPFEECWLTRDRQAVVNPELWPPPRAGRVAVVAPHLSAVRSFQPPSGHSGSRKWGHERGIPKSRGCTVGPNWYAGFESGACWLSPTSSDGIDSIQRTDALCE